MVEEVAKLEMEAFHGLQFRFVGRLTLTLLQNHFNKLSDTCQSVSEKNLA